MQSIFCAHWPPIVQAFQDGMIDHASLSQADQEFLHNFHVAAMLGWVRAMLDWPRVETVDFRCPTLWLVGSEDRHAVASAKEFESSIPHSMVQVQIIEGLDHNQLFDEIERVFPTILTFTQFRTLGAQRE